MSFRDYLHEKAEESRHMETLAFIMFLTGALLFVGGLLETIGLSGEPNWFLLIPYRTELSMGTYLGLTLVITGICMGVSGIVFGISHSRQRGWYMQELRQSGVPADHRFSERTLNEPRGKMKKEKP